jgi:hypothetical protein
MKRNGHIASEEKHKGREGRKEIRGFFSLRVLGDLLFKPNAKESSQKCMQSQLWLRRGRKMSQKLSNRQSQSGDFADSVIALQAAGAFYHVPSGSLRSLRSLRLNQEDGLATKNPARRSRKIASKGETQKHEGREGRKEIQGCFRLRVLGDLLFKPHAKESSQKCMQSQLWLGRGRRIIAKLSNRRSQSGDFADSVTALQDAGASYHVPSGSLCSLRSLRLIPSAVIQSLRFNSPDIQPAYETA